MGYPSKWQGMIRKDELGPSDYIRRAQVGELSSTRVQTEQQFAEIMNAPCLLQYQEDPS
jgi:hypothetical protein